LLAHSPLAAEVQRVISVGHATLSRPVTQLLARTDLEIVHVGDQSTFPVPAGANVTFVDDLSVTGPADPGWLQAWLDADAQVRAAVDAQLDGTTPLDVARTVWDAASDGLLVIGSSSPIRDLDLVATPRADAPRALANRGLAGIDGTLSTAIGAALATPEARALAVVGDLTFLHGANGLLVGPQEPRPDLTIVVVNDDGGSIFSTLEQGAPDYAEAFERVFGTPTGTDLAALCAAHGVGHRRVGAPDLAAALARPQSGIEVVEVPVSRADRRALAGRIDEAARHLFSR
ncbi:MAG: 2-succinyl-5-enolpyruvyl-6-hydroxy-3-cyclohexene-1-carboxylate synthase, partial [Actinomycetales bacterium]